MTTVNQYRVWCTDPTAHYEYAWGTTPPTVCPSDASPINPSLTTVVDTVSSSDVSVDNFPQTAFGELSVAPATPVLQLYFTYNNNPQLTTTSVTGSGTITNSSGMVVISSGAATSSSAKLSSIKPLKYRPGQGILTRFTGIFTSGVTGNTQTVGLYDADNGVGFGYNGASFGLFRRSNTITTWISQSSWNLDTLNGTGPSGVNINFASGYGNVFQIKFQYLGFGGLTYYIENPATGKFIAVHIIQFANSSLTPSFDIPSFPLTIQSINTTNNTNVIVKTASMMAAIEGLVIYNGPQFNFSWNGTSVTSGSDTFIAAFNIKTTFASKTNKIVVYAKSSTYATGNADKAQILRLWKNSTFTTPAWTDINTSQSCVQYLSGGSWNAGTGTITWQQNIAGGGVPTTIIIEPSETSLYGVAGENLIITLNGFGAGSSWGSFIWIEDQ